MLNETFDTLQNFYAKYNKELVELVKDNKFSWPVEPS